MPLNYPRGRRDETVNENYHGTPVGDPYRWLEDPDAPETQAWVAQENEVTQKYFSDNCKYRGDLKQRLTDAYDYPKYSCWERSGDFYYFFKNDGLQNQSVMNQQTSLTSEPVVFLDPNTLSTDGTAALKARSFTHDGALLAYGISRSGSDWQTIYVMDTRTRQLLPDKVEWSKFSGITWTRDNRGFFYCRYAAPKVLETDQDGDNTKRGSETTASEFQEVFYHVLGTPQEADVRVFGCPDQRTWMFGTDITKDGRYLIITVSDGCLPVNRLFYAELEKLATFENIQPVKLIDNFDAEYSPITNKGSVFWLKTNLNAPKYKIIQIDFANPAKESWREVIPESEDVLNNVMSINHDKLVVVYMHHVREIMQIRALDGTLIQDINLPDLGSIVQLCGREQDSEFFYMFSSFVYPYTIFRYDCQSLSSTLFKETPVPNHDSSAFETNQVFYPSKDGTMIPMFLVSKKGLQKTGEKPVYLYGYGGFSISLTPSFSVFRTTFIKTFDSILAIPNIRGGGEYGEDWHTQAIIEKRQNAFDDFQGAAEYLIREGYTNSSRICIAGGSNGGLLVATCANQRPDLFRCVISQVPVTDMLRFHKFTIGHAWCTDYGCSDNPEHFKALHAYSPLHNVRSGVQYPAILVTTADHDDRVVPLHSFKYAATLQHVAGDSNEQPLLIRVETKAGHGAGKPTAKVIEEVADIYAFVAHNLRLDWH